MVVQCVFTFVVTIGALRISSKHGAKQLLRLEFGLILILGSAAGDATLYHDTRRAWVLVMFVVIIALYVRPTG